MRAVALPGRCTASQPWAWPHGPVYGQLAVGLALAGSTRRGPAGNTRGCWQVREGRVEEMPCLIRGTA